MNDIKEAGEIEKFEKRKKEIEKKYKNLNTERLRFLDQHIFRSMANLTFFFEYLAKYPILLDIYEDHVMELLGIDQPSSDKTPNNFIFDRFLNSIIRSSVTSKKLSLLNSMQYIIYQELINLSGSVLGDENLDIVSQDTYRPLYWIQILLKVSQTISDYKNKTTSNYKKRETIKRPVKF